MHAYVTAGGRERERELHKHPADGGSWMYKCWDVQGERKGVCLHVCIRAVRIRSAGRVRILSDPESIKECVKHVEHPLRREVNSYVEVRGG